MKSDETLLHDVARLASLRADTDPILDDLGSALAHQATRLTSKAGPTDAAQLLETFQTRAEIEAGRAGETVTEGYSNVLNCLRAKANEALVVLLIESDLNYFTVFMDQTCTTIVGALQSCKRE
jgi:hypothetical protein